MEEERILTGYCRQLDASRVVEVIEEDGVFQEADCAFGSCIYESSCPIAAQIRGEES